MKVLLIFSLAVFSMNVSSQWKNHIKTDPLTDETINVVAFSFSDNQSGGLEVNHMLNEKTLNSIITVPKNGQNLILNQTLYVRIKVDGNKIIERIGVVTKANDDAFQINIDQVYSDNNISLFKDLINEMKKGSRMIIGIGDKIYKFSLKGSSKALGTVMATI